MTELTASEEEHRRSSTVTALRFVLIIGVVSFFGDFTYEGARGVLGQYLASLGAGGATISVITGLGALLGYALRLVSGREADRTGRFWSITIFGYFLQLLAVPALALTGNWPAAAALVFLERAGKATRNPPRDAMLSHAAKSMGGYGWAFGVHEAFDQAGAVVGPLAMAAVLAFHKSYRLAFGALLIPALVSLVLVLIARRIYPHPELMEDSNSSPLGEVNSTLPRVFWLYLIAAGLVAAGFADFPLIAYHLQSRHLMKTDSISLLYALAMGVSGAGSLLFGRLFDRFGFRVILILTMLSAVFAPLVFLGSTPGVIAGICLWGLGMGVHESVIPAAIAPMVQSGRRASAYGLFTAGYGVAWFVGSVIIGLLYDLSLWGTVIFCVAAECSAVPILWSIARSTERPLSSARA